MHAVVTISPPSLPPCLPPFLPPSRSVPLSFPPDVSSLRDWAFSRNLFQLFSPSKINFEVKRIFLALQNFQLPKQECNSDLNWNQNKVVI